MDIHVHVRNIMHVYDYTEYTSTRNSNTCAFTARLYACVYMYVHMCYSSACLNQQTGKVRRTTTKHTVHVPITMGYTQSP